MLFASQLFSSLVLKELMITGRVHLLPYFFGDKTVFSFQNNPKNLDPSYKMDLDLWDYLGRVKLVLQQNFIGLV